MRIDTKIGSRARIGPASLLVLAFLVMAPGPGTRAADTASVVVRDDLGRRVTITAPVKRIISLQPEASRILAALGCGSSLVAFDYFLKKHDPLFARICPSSIALPVVAYEDASVNLEAVVRLDPDLIIASPYDAHIPDSLQEKTGRPVMAISSLGRFDRLLGEIRLLGRVTDRQARAEELVAFFQETIDRVAKAVNGVPLEQRPRAYLAFWSSLTRTPVSYEPVEVAGGRNIGRGLIPSYPGSDGASISVERLVRFEPDIILVHGNYPPGERKITVNGILGDRRLASLQAVRGKNVFYTFGFWSWWDPAQVLVETLYLAKVFHPALFREVSLAREANAIYHRFYGIENGYDVLNQATNCDEWLKD